MCRFKITLVLPYCFASKFGSKIWTWKCDARSLLIRACKTNDLEVREGCFSVGDNSIARLKPVLRFFHLRKPVILYNKASHRSVSMATAAWQTKIQARDKGLFRERNTQLCLLSGMKKAFQMFFFNLEMQWLISNMT